MSSTSLFLTKYQPEQLRDFEMDNQNRLLLKSLISLDRISLLFTGDVGCGKTTLIKIVLNEYYKDCPNVSIDSQNKDILYVTNLKEQGITYFRGEFKMFCQTFPEISGKRKIVIIDDIDGVNFHCQQLLRNCIDKYPKVSFIAGCTNINNVIDALQSRFTVMRLPLLEHSHMMRIATKISNLENIRMELKAKREMVLSCNNQAKKMITYLEKIKLMDTPIGAHNINKVYVVDINSNFKQYLKHLKKKIYKSISILYDLYDSGYSPIDIFNNFYNFVKSAPDISDDIKYKIIADIATHMARIHTVHDDPIELALFTNKVQTSMAC